MVLNVLEKLGGEDWLLNEAVADPKAYMALLSKMIPKQSLASDLGDITVKLINRYGDTLEISHDHDRAAIPAAGADSDEDGLGQPIQIATGGSPPAEGGLCNPRLIERYEDE